MKTEAQIMSKQSNQNTYLLHLEKDEVILLYYTLIRVLGALQEGQKKKAEGYTGEEIKIEIKEVETLIAKVKELVPIIQVAEYINYR